jgi:hypothetical protein
VRNNGLATSRVIRLDDLSEMAFANDHIDIVFGKAEVFGDIAHRTSHVAHRTSRLRRKAWGLCDGRLSFSAQDATAPAVTSCDGRDGSSIGFAPTCWCLIYGVPLFHTA